MVKDVLIVEDNNHKRERIITFLHETFPKCKVIEAHSFTAACKRIAEQEFAAVLMDMSLPTYDKSATESGGRFRAFGGRELARKIIRRSISTKILFITQYQSFSERGTSQTFESLDEEVRLECGSHYIGFVHYDSSRSAWKEKITETLGCMLNETTDS
ncbi:Response regulator receiver domain-containing protein [Burkholderia sp. YR290]|nr:Response regulator receiver domain-containing protein [Burkholderia sp. YR290]